jgi:hypothetical protein
MLRRSSLCSLLQSPITFSLLHLNFLLSTTFSAPPVYVGIVWTTKFHTRTEEQLKLYCYKVTLNFTLTGSSLCSSYCRQNLQKGGVCIFVTEDQNFNNVIPRFTVQGRLCKSMQLNLKLNHLT